jgi:hypothetical protein
MFGLWMLDSTADGATFEAVLIDGNIQIGYGVAVADVDGDKRLDVVLADKTQIIWYHNPDWSKHVIAENLTAADNVCLAATDLDGDGKAELAVGAGWNPSDTVGSGAIFYLVAPEDRTQRWKPVQLPHEPTVHRMRWFKNVRNSYELAVLPLHGRGNKNGEGTGVKFLSYDIPFAKPQDKPQLSVIDDSLHQTHNFRLVNWTGGQGDEFLVASREGIFHLIRKGGEWTRTELAGQKKGTEGFAGAGEVAAGLLPGGTRFVVSVEPMHGNQMVVYTASEGGGGETWKRQVIDNELREGHALATGDLLQTGSDQIVMGWRTPNASGKTGIRLYESKQDGSWSRSEVDSEIACEDLVVADLDSDGQLDIVASGRATRNVKVYFNRNSGTRVRQ